MAAGPQSRLERQRAGAQDRRGAGLGSAGPRGGGAGAVKNGLTLQRVLGDTQTHSAGPDHHFQTSSGSDYHLPFGMPARPLGTEATRPCSGDERWLLGTSFPNCSFFLLVDTVVAPAPSSLLAEMSVILLIRPAQHLEAGSFEVPKIIGHPRCQSDG